VSVKIFEDERRDGYMQNLVGHSFLEHWISIAMVFWTLLQKIPGQKLQVFVGTCTLFAVAAYPVISKEQKKGHDLFSQDKPQAVEKNESDRDKLRRHLG